VAENNPDIGAWVKSQFQRANAHLASKGLIPADVYQKESRYLPPLVAIWKMNAKQNGKSVKVWVLSGDLPVDFTSVSAAENAGDALRYFALQWQIQAQNIRSSAANDKVKQDYANLLESRAEGLFDLFAKDELWKNEGVV